MKSIFVVLLVLGFAGLFCFAEETDQTYSIGSFNGGLGKGQSGWITEQFMIAPPDLGTFSIVTHATLAGWWRPFHFGIGFLGLDNVKLDSEGNPSWFACSLGAMILEYGEIGLMVNIAAADQQGSWFMGTIGAANTNDIDVLASTVLAVSNSFSLRGRSEMFLTWDVDFFSADAYVRWTPKPCTDTPFFFEGGIMFAQKKNWDCPWEPYREVGFGAGGGFQDDQTEFRGTIFVAWSTTQIYNDPQWGVEISLTFVPFPRK